MRITATFSEVAMLCAVQKGDYLPYCINIVIQKIRLKSKTTKKEHRNNKTTTRLYYLLSINVLFSFQLYHGGSTYSFNEKVYFALTSVTAVRYKFCIN